MAASVTQIPTSLRVSRFAFGTRPHSCRLLPPQQARHSAVPRAGRARTVIAYATADGKMKVLVTGAAGKTGKLVVEKLLAQGEKFEAHAAVRSAKSADALKASGVPAERVHVVDIAADAAPALASALEGCEGLVIATSAVPQIKPLSLVTMMVKKLFKQEGARPEFTWKEGQFPEQVDWEGQKVQIDAAKAAGVRKVVLVSSMGGTQPDNMLNKIGDGNILVWKRKAERYLVDSGLNYTVIHPGGLVDEEGGKRELVLGVDDELLQLKVRSIPRADVAELCVQSLVLKEADNRSIDAITKPLGEGSPVSDIAGLLRSMSRNCDYALPKAEAVAKEPASASA